MAELTIDVAAPESLASVISQLEALPVAEQKAFAAKFMPLFEPGHEALTVSWSGTTAIVDYTDKAKTILDDYGIAY